MSVTAARSDPSAALSAGPAAQCHARRRVQTRAASQAQPPTMFRAARLVRLSQTLATEADVGCVAALRTAIASGTRRHPIIASIDYHNGGANDADDVQLRLDTLVDASTATTLTPSSRLPKISPRR